jgi:hypothetical protein
MPGSRNRHNLTAAVSPCKWICGDNRLVHLDWKHRDSTGQSLSWETNSSSPSQEILHVLWSPKIHYRIHNSRLVVPILSRTDPVFLTTILIISPRLRPLFYVVSLTFPNPNPVCISRLPISATCTIHPFLDHRNIIWLEIKPTLVLLASSSLSRHAAFNLPGLPTSTRPLTWASP